VNALEASEDLGRGFEMPLPDCEEDTRRVPMLDPDAEAEVFDSERSRVIVGSWIGEEVKSCEEGRDGAGEGGAGREEWS
jgi:hypothetical protein